MRPNTGKVVIDGTKDIIVKGSEGLPVVGPILVPVTSAVVDQLKDGENGKQMENQVNEILTGDE